MTIQFQTPLSASDTLSQVFSMDHNGVLAVISGVVGPSYRPVGAIMGIHANGTRIGNLSSGCVENDIVIHAQEVQKTGQAKMLRYGAGSRYFDIQLPCGGGLEILLVPVAENTGVLLAALKKRNAREPFSFGLCSQSNRITVDASMPSGWNSDVFFVGVQPDLQFLVFGKGPEAWTFASLVNPIGYSTRLFSPDIETLEFATMKGCTAEHITTCKIPKTVKIDEWTAIILFFHDHDLEPAILCEALESSAQYVGAQGSRSTAANRVEFLKEIGGQRWRLEKTGRSCGIDTFGTRRPDTCGVCFSRSAQRLS